MPSSNTAKMGPTEQSATRPKLFSLLLRSPKTPAIPTPRAMIKGTVIGPVVTPPESKARGNRLSLPLTTSISARANNSM